MTISRVAACLLAAMISAAPVAHPAHATDTGAEPSLLAFGARIAGDDARTRIVIDFDRKPEYSVHYIANPPRIVVDLPETAFGFAASDLEPRGLFRDIRYGTMGEGSARLVLTASGPTRLAMSEVQPDEAGKGYRLVLDAEMVSDLVFADLVKSQEWQQVASVAPSVTRGDRVASDAVKPGDDFVIAVDAGHGGIDAGASGVETKTEEKQVTLAFAKTLVERLNKEAGIKAFLTRDKDEFLSLSQRVQMARQHHANLFISLHADTVRQKEIRGATVYTLSENASDALAANMAARENLSDEIAGIRLTEEPEEVADILLDLTRRETQAYSVTMARAIVSSFEGQVGLINNPHRFAGFRVLQAPDVPSILLELGFLSNKDDERLLLDESWRGKIADLLTEALKRYRSPNVAKGG
ncbi:N-acetylmuramoyl-L-alanine amidase [Rhizobiaceae bacterium n13]|uniref:N-acetylmuramoyl-L-alanine amidase n=1 Tax=Ferirhizobium litorale TaxID=2927786 RepID=A0AAE3U308_9HYPH|nr:N-acetylmuramoyl-L-alanine amidase [Fererhizobium litorale]MDI7864417.1 N-acetylmuramoyl-L-alanine amidase [Fererhizobium litorale]MDI7924669.1 N-acetylmuramoyl-L-alanine amidase [Fererhizobium litorale]